MGTRGEGESELRVLVAEDMQLMADSIARSRRGATRRGRDLALTNKELGVLEVLVTAHGRVVSSEELLERVWDAHVDPFTNTVRVTLANLRRKLGDPPLIITVIGAGYRIERA